MKSMCVIAGMCLLAAFSGCGEGSSPLKNRPPADGGFDAGSDAAPPVDGGFDAGSDAAPPVDGGFDAGFDAAPPVDGGFDAGSDAAPPATCSAADECNQAPRCDDGVRNGDEVDRDCGGSCARCAAGQACVIPHDCQAGICAAGSCKGTFVIHGRVFDTLGVAVPSADVHVASGERAVSDAAGAFDFTVAAGNEIVFVKADGYAASAVPVRGALGDTTVQAIMSPVGATASFASGDPIFFQRADGLRIEGPAGIFVDPQGQPVSGPVTLHLTPIDPNDPLAMQSAPAQFPADDGMGHRAPIAPAALMDITALSGSTRLNIAKGSELLVDIPILGENPTLDATVWSFNEPSGLWQPEGGAVRTADDLGHAVYRTRITHLSYWYWAYADGRSSFDLYHWECIDLTVTQNKIPLAYAVVHLSPAYMPAWTDENGRISGAYLYKVDPIEVHAHTNDYAYQSASITLPARPTSGCRKGGVLDITVPGAPSCPADSKWCGSSGGCKNTSSDPNNCGACSNVCAAGLSCRAGVCACDPGRTSCSGTCLDLKADRQNCGACGKTCLDWQECSTGACVDKACPSGMTRCGANCVDIHADNDAHCGACNRSCPGDDYCRAGECIVVPDCGDGRVDSGEWTEVCDDGKNDGSYGSCMPGCLALGPRCGDATLQAASGELCDNGSATPCPASCDDGVACTADARTGSAASCNVVCTNTPIVVAAAGDGCCPPGANANTDPDCPPVCGNSIVEPGEVCDDGINDSAYGGCMSGCKARAPFCGDGVVQPAFLETCDPLSATPCPSSCDDADACTIDVQTGTPETCTMACARTTITALADGDRCCPAGANALSDGDCPPVCGNGIVEGPELCDDAINDGSYDGCAVGCRSFGPHCGDGVTDVGHELCDGNCSAMLTCMQPDLCTEVGLLGSAANCDLHCFIRPITAAKNDDACCPDGANSTTDNDCDPACGNGVLEPGETCDDGNPLDGDGCSADCASDETCGNHVVDTAAGELCDDGNALDGDGCSGDCKNIEECLTDHGGCSADADCVDTLSGRTCTCHAGYGGDGVTCSDIDECALGIDSCDPLVSCSNTAGSYVCGNCPSGYQNTGNGCADIDECAVDNGGCSVACANLPGSFTCGSFGPVVPSSLFSCAIHDSGALFCWGDKAKIGYGDQLTGMQLRPSRIGSDSDWDQIDLGNGNTCGLRDGALYCFGLNNYGQCGDGTTETPRTTPVRVGTASDWTAIALGSFHTCGLRGGALYCWGYNELGAIGDGTQQPRSLPTQIGSATDWTAITAGGQRTCGLRAGGAMYCWGWDDANGIHDGSTPPLLVPTQVGTLTGWTQVATSGTHTCALRAGELWCWQFNDKGQLGDGSLINRLAPVRVGSASNWSEVSVGPSPSHTCGRRAGVLYCWGDNSQGQFGDGTTSTFPTKTPLQIGVATDWSVLSTGWGYSCGYRNGAAYCWGRNSQAQLGDGTQVNSPSPLLIKTGP
jgi:cysteine-rich repeat protein